MCGGGNRWGINPEAAMAATVDLVGAGINPAQGMPVILATCDNCGFVASFQAKKLGLF
jgi:hypothetical protein